MARGSGRAPPIARLEFLRSRIEALEAVVAAIARNPRRNLTAEEVRLPYHRARGVRGPEILRSMRAGLLLRETAQPGSAQISSLWVTINEINLALASTSQVDLQIWLKGGLEAGHYAPEHKLERPGRRDRDSTRHLV